jgi:nicotinamide-nucleotide amidase
VSAGPTPPALPESAHDLPESAHDLIAALAAGGNTLAVAESLTGGQLVATLTAVPGASRVVRGAVIAYAPDVKASLLAVDTDLLDARGPVCAEVAVQMASGVRAALGASYGVSTTGEAGPESASGKPVGTVHVAVDGPRGSSSRAFRFPGPRSEVQHAAVQAALRLLAESQLAASPGGDAGAHQPRAGNNPD